MYSTQWTQRRRICAAAVLSRAPPRATRVCPDRADMKLGRREASAQRITNQTQVTNGRDYMMLATLCSVGKCQLGGPIRGAQGCRASRRSRACFFGFR